MMRYVVLLMVLCYYVFSTKPVIKDIKNSNGFDDYESTTVLFLIVNGITLLAGFILLCVFYW